MNIFLALNDRELQTLTAKMLRIVGHNPCESTKTNLANAIKAHWLEFLLVDLNLEPSGAEELVAVARAKYPQLPVLLTSGGELDESMKRRVAEMRAEFLQRPHTSVVLKAAINRTKLLSSTVTIGSFWEMMALSERIFLKNYNSGIPKETKCREGFLREFEKRLDGVINEIKWEFGSPTDIMSIRIGTTLKGKTSQLLADLIFWLECQQEKL